MNEKTFLITIPMLPTESLKPLVYRDNQNDFVSSKTRFPGLAMLENNISNKDNIKIITIRTIGKETEKNYILFKEELKNLSERHKIQLNIDREIEIPFSETIEKEKNLLRKIFDCFQKRSYIYMDLTYGSKMTAIELFSSLCYAEIAADCVIKSVVYGKNSFDDSGNGELFDVMYLYNTVRFMDTATQMDKKCFKNMINQFVE